MKKIYRIYVLGDIPRSLSDQVSKLHGEAILRCENNGAMIPAQGSTGPTAVTALDGFTRSRKGSHPDKLKLPLLRNY